MGLGHPYTYGVCGACGSYTLLDPPDDLSDYYPPDYYSYELPEVERRRLVRRVRQMRADASLDSHAGRADRLAAKLLGRPPWRSAIFAGLSTRQARILDVGCGAGALLHEMWSDGFTELTGVDPFLGPSVAARLSRPGLRFLACELGDVGGEFDLIMFNHSLEHMPDPAVALGHATQRLSRDGVVLVRLPLADSVGAARFGGSWFCLEAPRHLFVPSRLGVQRLAARSGFEVVAQSDDLGGFCEAWSILYERGISGRTQEGRPRRLEDHFSPEELAEFG